MRSRSAFIALILGIFISQTSAAQPEAGQLVSSRDIAQAVDYGLIATAFTCTASGRLCTAVRSEADVGRGIRGERLELIDLHQVRRVIAAPAANSQDRYSPRVLAEFQTRRAGSITKIRWLSDHEIAFLARSERTNDIAQLFIFDLRSGRLSQHTHHPRDVINYDISARRDTVLFSALAQPAQRRPGDPVLPDTFFETLSNPSPFPLLDFFLLRSGESTARSVGDCEAHSSSNFVSLSPDGHRALVNCLRDRVPAQWLDYESFYELEARTWSPRIREQWVLPDLARPGPFWSSPELTYVDLETGRSIGLGLPLSNQARASWAPDGSTALLLSNWPPVGQCQNGVCRRNAAGRIDYSEQYSNLTIDFPSFRVSRLSNAAGSTTQGQALRADWADKDRFQLVYAQGRGPERVEIAHPYHRMSEGWLPVGAPIRSPAPVTLELRIAKGGVTPPEIAAVETASGLAHVLTNDNARLRERTYGRFERLTWRDRRYDREVTGTVLYPPAYRPGRAYSTVVAFYGLGMDFFSNWHDLSARNVVIFSPDCSLTRLGQEPTHANFSSSATLQGCFEAATDELVRRGIADRNRIGIAGFSNTGARGMETLVFSDYPIAAATITDSFIVSPADYASFLGSYGYGMREFDQPYPAPEGSLIQNSHIGAPPFGAGVGLWLERSGFFSLDRVRTPIRFEYHGYGSVAWNDYAVLRRMGRPVEMVQLPGEEHWARTARGAFAFQSGIADWFDFWLNDHEDPDPAKREQYARWRELRTQRDAVAREPRPPLREWTSRPRTSGAPHASRASEPATASQ